MATFVSTFLGDRPVRRLAPYIYAVLVALLFFHPHFSAHIGPELKPYIEGLTNLSIFGLGVLTYYIYKREQREFERRFLETSTYIGAMNRKLPLLQNITTDLLLNGLATAKQKSRVFEELVGLACGTVAKSEQGLLRFVEVGTGRTVKEFHYELGNKHPHSAVAVGNRDLLLSVASGKTAHVSPARLVIAASDGVAAMRVFLVVPNPSSGISEHISTLQAIVDQGQILSRYVFDGFSKKYA